MNVTKCDSKTYFISALKIVDKSAFDVTKCDPLHILGVTKVTAYTRSRKENK